MDRRDVDKIKFTARRRKAGRGRHRGSVGDELRRTAGKCVKQRRILTLKREGIGRGRRDAEYARVNLEHALRGDQYIVAVYVSVRGTGYHRRPQLGVLGHEHGVQGVEHRPGDVPVEVVGGQVQRVGVGQQMRQAAGDGGAVFFTDADVDAGRRWAGVGGRIWFWPFVSRGLDWGAADGPVSLAG